MTQNIYDSAEFFAGYSQLPRSQMGFNGAPEWPAIRALLPPLTKASLVDLGCGLGWFCRWAKEQGASHIVGMDVSENMLSRATEMTPAGDGIQYIRADLECLSLPERRFDLIYSSLTFHYLENLDALMATMYQALKPGGWLVFSAEHPIFTAPSSPDWVCDHTNKRLWPLDQYLQEGQRTTNWLAEGVVKQHRTLGTYVNTLLNQGFQLKHLQEWKPDDQQIKQQPDLVYELERPMFFIVAAQRV